jgi:phosphotransferase system  glucose/maltose/N-acetylglucosamine-specific IIC component
MQDHNLTKDLQEQDVGHLPDMVLMWFYCYCWWLVGVLFCFVYYFLFCFLFFQLPDSGVALV